MEYSIEQRGFLTELLAKADRRNDWVMIMQFAMPTLLDNQEFLIGFLIERTMKEQRCNESLVKSIMLDLMKELSLKFIVGEA